MTRGLPVKPRRKPPPPDSTPLVKTTARALSRLHEQIALAALEDDTIAALAERLEAAEVTAEKWLERRGEPVDKRPEQTPVMTVALKTPPVKIKRGEEIENSMPLHDSQLRLFPSNDG